MPLFDHFHPPLKEDRSWDAFHSRWATALADSLNLRLPAIGCFAEALATRGRVEIEVAAERDPRARNGAAASRPSQRTAGGVATMALPTWTPAAPALEMEVHFPPEGQVLVFSESARALVGAIEIVSPGNKDRPSSRRAFAVKCLSYLQSGVGLIIADIVTERGNNLHDEMADLIGGAPKFPGSPPLCAAAYRPFKRSEQDRVGVWPVELKLGDSLPVLPLWLRNHEEPIPVDLDAGYVEACQKLLID